MSVLDTSIVNIAIPTMQTALNASVDDIEWVVTGYTLVLGVVVPLTGWLGLRHRADPALRDLDARVRPRAPRCAGCAWNLTSMIAFRVVQAIPGGILPVVTMTLLYQIVPRAKIGTAMGLYGLGVVVAPAIGPTLGGALVEYFDWRLIFFINVPIGIVGVVLAVMVFPQIRPTTWPRLDFLGLHHHRLRPVRPAARVLRGAGLGLDRLPGARPVRLRGAEPGAVRDHRERGATTR